MFFICFGPYIFTSFTAFWELFHPTIVISVVTPVKTRARLCVRAVSVFFSVIFSVSMYPAFRLVSCFTFKSRASRACCAIPRGTDFGFLSVAECWTADLQGNLIDQFLFELFFGMSYPLSAGNDNRWSVKSTTGDIRHLVGIREDKVKYVKLWHWRGVATLFTLSCCSCCTGWLICCRCCCCWKICLCYWCHCWLI